MIDIAYFCFLIYACIGVIKQRKTMLEYGATHGDYLLLLMSLLLCFFHWVMPFVLPELYYPIPIAACFYIPIIIVGRKHTLKYETSGTSLSNEAENASRHAVWVGFAGIALTLIVWIFAFSSSNLSNVY